MLTDLNTFIEHFNRHWHEYADVPFYNEDDLNKLCLQNATGSGKTLLMHVNLLQYRNYAGKHGKDRELSRVVLLTPNERLSEQHIAEFKESNIPASNFAKEGHTLFTQAKGLARVDVLEITKLPESFHETQSIYMTACLLKFYQQLRIYEEKARDFDLFNLEKPLWVFVGSTVSKVKGGTEDEKSVASDVALIIQFIADFLDNPQTAVRRVNEILTGKGQDTGLLDRDGNDIFAGAFAYLARTMNEGESIADLYRDILSRLFNNAAGGHLSLSRIKGESGEVALRVGTSEIPFGLINVGDAKSLCDHVTEVAVQKGIRLTVEDSDFTEAMFASVKDSTSPVNLLIGSKKFVEGWDCWRVSTMGLMHVGRSEGSQIIQLFGRGVRLKGYEWSLKRSGHSHAPFRPTFIEELETLNVFGIEADFMEKFREFLKEEGLPGNERRKIITIPLNVTYDFGKKLKILRPKRKSSDGKEYDFKKDAPVPTVGDIPDYLTHNTVVSD